MKPENIGYMTQLDDDYGAALKAVIDGESFASFLAEYSYWLDDEVKELKPEDWNRVEPLLLDMRTEGVEPEEKHNIAIALLMPSKIFRVSIFAAEFCVPWGCAYIRAKECNVIKY